MTRRTLFKWLIKAGTFVIGALIGIPSLLSGMAPAFQRRRTDQWRPVGQLDDFPVGAVREAQVDPSVGGWPHSLRPQSVYVWRTPDTETPLIVFSRLCTDLGCPVTYDPGSACFYCPCHGGIFTADGDRLAGPPERPLDRYTVRVRQGVVEVDVGSVPATS